MVLSRRTGLAPQRTTGDVEYGGGRQDHPSGKSCQRQRQEQGREGESSTQRQEYARDTGVQATPLPLADNRPSVFPASYRDMVVELGGGHSIP